MTSTSSLPVTKNAEIATTNLQPQEKEKDFQIPNPEKSGLKSLFNAIIKGDRVFMDTNILKDIISCELHIPITGLDPQLVTVLPYMLVSYVKSWPGWNRLDDYKKGLLKLEEWFDKFVQYATFKIKFLIQKGFQKVVDELEGEISKNPKQATSSSKIKSSVETQFIPESKNCKSFSPFRINIKGPPRILNTLIFTAEEDDIHLKMHTMKPWALDFSLQQLLNWPFLELEFISPFFNFTRKMMPDYLRYLARTDDTMLFRKQDFIEEVRIEPGVKRTPYSLSFLKQFMKQYIDYLKTQNFEEVVIREICSVLGEFYRDLSEVGAVCGNVIHDSTRISFNMGGCRYVRNKKSATLGIKDTGTAVGFCEVITPKCSFMLKKILDIGELSTLKPSLPAGFFGLTEDALKKQHSIQIDKMPSMIYSCNYCKKQYEGLFARDVVLKHYQVEHRMEHAIMCFDCKKQFDVAELSKSRWYHPCYFNPKGVNPTAVNLFESSE